jgi:hypothetical protein
MFMNVTKFVNKSQKKDYLAVSPDVTDGTESNSDVKGVILHESSVQLTPGTG